MSDLLDLLAEIAQGMEPVSVSDEPFAPCTQPGQKYIEREPLDNYGKWYYWLVGLDENGNEIFIRDKDGWCIWCPFWAYNTEEAVTESLILVIEAHRTRAIEFSEYFITGSKIEQMLLYSTLITNQYRYLKYLERHTSADRPDKDWFLRYISERKSLLRRKYSSLLEH